jgi:hypothetical protein
LLTQENTSFDYSLKPISQTLLILHENRRPLYKEYKGLEMKKARPKPGLKYPQRSKGSSFMDGVPKDSGANNSYKFGGV